MLEPVRKPLRVIECEGQDVEVFGYDLSTYPFRDRAEQTFSGQPLHTLRAHAEGLLKPIEDQKTVHHQAWYANWHRLAFMYTQFVRDEIRPHFVGPILFQKVPTFRVQYPNNLAVGEFHKDGDYGHPEGETVFWVPLTYASGSSAVQMGGRSLDVVPGEYWKGNTRDFNHGNVPNETGTTRVSFDFRVLPVSMYRPADAKSSISRGLKFVRGEYWSDTILE